jgi:hypothetical protein
MKGIFIICFLVFLLLGCGTVTNFNLSSKESISELYAPCSGPMNYYYIKINGQEAIDMSIHRKNESIEIYLSAHNGVLANIVWSPVINVKIADKEISISESAKLGENVLKEGVAYYRIPSTANELSFNLGLVTFNSVAHEFKPFILKYEPRKFLMCVQ